MATPERALRALTLAIKTREDLIAEARRVTDLPTWVHAAILAEYDRDVFLAGMNRGDALRKHCEDVGMHWQPASVNRWIRSCLVWRKTNVAVRMKLQAEVYYHEAQASTKYRDGSWTATKAVVHQSNRREERSVRSYTNGIASLTRLLDMDRANVTWLTPERAKELLEMLPKIAAYLHKVAAKRKHAA